MYLTEAEYAAIVGEDAPGEFAEYLLLAEGYFNLQTHSYFEQLPDLTAVPTIVMGKIKSLIAYSVLNIEQQGGVIGMIEPKEADSVSLGKFSMSGLRGAPSGVSHPVMATILPYIMAYIRGVEV